MTDSFKIGTRGSPLALAQAHMTAAALAAAHGWGPDVAEIVVISTTGDRVQDRPLAEIGGKALWTKELDAALIDGRIDCGVHSMKDVPTALPKGIVQAAVLERANALDILVHKGNLDFLENTGIIATGSLRRQAQWWNRYPNHSVVDLRGNVNTRMQKLKENDWNGAVFAAAGLERINQKPDSFINLDWMIPAPAQGAMVIVAMENDNFTIEALSQLNHIETEICTYIERQFLKTLEGGCTAPIGALAKYDEEEDTIEFKGILLSIDGKQKLEINRKAAISEWKKLGFKAAQEVLENGGAALMTKIKNELKK
jgi:hydroxymethylbilane synthase